MSVARTCLPCRAAKAKCDLARPACGRCQRRGLACLGLTADEGFIFLDENQRAQRNSERARRERRISTRSPITFDIEPASSGKAQASTQTPTLNFKQLYPWLNDRSLGEMPTTLSYDLESRAVDRFFISWTLFPCNNGISPGHMHELPMLYSSAPAESILWHAVRAMAFADMRHHYTGDIPFTTKALRHYGSALQSLQNIVDDGHLMADDRVLAAMLLIDSFESLYLGRTEPLGPHFDAVLHVLHARGENQFFNHAGFSLWRVAHHRLLARQIMKREEPFPEQVAWFSKLDINNTQLRISSDVQRMSSLAGASKKLISSDVLAESSPAESTEQARQLIRAIQDLLESIEEWTNAMTETWKPKFKDPDEIRQWEETDDSSYIPIPHFKCPRTLSYRNIWLAYMWNFHAASQIVLRESLDEVVAYAATLQPGYRDEDEMEKIGFEQQNAVHKLSSIIIRSFPQLLGFMHKETREPHPLPKGKMVGRFFSLFAMCVVRTARFTTNEHKQTASEVISWISSSHGLG